MSFSWKNLGHPPKEVVTNYNPSLERANSLEVKASLPPLGGHFLAPFLAAASRKKGKVRPSQQYSCAQDCCGKEIF